MEAAPPWCSSVLWVWWGAPPLTPASPADLRALLGSVGGGTVGRHRCPGFPHPPAGPGTEQVALGPTLGRVDMVCINT